MEEAYITNDRGGGMHSTSTGNATVSIELSTTVNEEKDDSYDGCKEGSFSSFQEPTMPDLEVQFQIAAVLRHLNGYTGPDLPTSARIARAAAQIDEYDDDDEFITPDEIPMGPTVNEDNVSWNEPINFNDHSTSNNDNNIAVVDDNNGDEGSQAHQQEGSITGLDNEYFLDAASQSNFSTRSNAREPLYFMFPQWLPTVIGRDNDRFNKKDTGRLSNVSSEYNSRRTVHSNEEEEEGSCPSLRYRTNYYYQSPSSVLARYDILKCNELKIFYPSLMNRRCPLTFTISKVLFETEHCILMLANDSYGKLYMLKTYSMFHRDFNAVRKEVIVQSNRSLNCKHILKVVATFIDNDYLFIVSESNTGKTLHDLIYHSIKKKKNRYCDDNNSFCLSAISRVHLEFKVKKFTKHIMSAIQLCHANGVIHRSIMPQNIFMDSNGLVKLGNFERCKRLKGSSVTVNNMMHNHMDENDNSDSNNNNNNNGSRRRFNNNKLFKYFCCVQSQDDSNDHDERDNRKHIINEVEDDDDCLVYGSGGICARERIAPEMRWKVKVHSGNRKTDMWGLGLTVYEMFYGKLPDEIERNRLNWKWIRFPAIPKISCEAQDFIQKLLHRNPWRRLTIDEAFEHAWIVDEHYHEDQPPSRDYTDPSM